jgi:hypothetical protein
MFHLLRLQSYINVIVQPRHCGSVRWEWTGHMWRCSGDSRGEAMRVLVPDQLSAST